MLDLVSCNTYFVLFTLSILLPCHQFLSLLSFILSILFTYTVFISIMPVLLLIHFLFYSYPACNTHILTIYVIDLLITLARYTLEVAFITYIHFILFILSMLCKELSLYTGSQELISIWTMTFTWISISLFS